MTGECSTASFGRCGQVHHGVICLTTSALTRLATIASFAGAERASGPVPARRTVSTRRFRLSTVRHVVATISRDKDVLHRGDAGFGAWNATVCCVSSAISGKMCESRLGGSPRCSNCPHMIRSELQSSDLASWPWWLWLLPFSYSASPSRSICKVCVERVPLCFSQWTSGVRPACARA
jgi:hypothetical protein